jgi:serpin B
LPTLFPKHNREVKTGEKKSAQPATGELASTGFAFRLFEALQPGRTNLAVSPYGARVLLALLCSGATQDTRKEMVEVLGLEDGAESNRNWYERKGRPLGHKLVTAEDGEEFLTANGIWLDAEFELKSAYVQAAQTDYGAETHVEDFAWTGAAENVNSWIHEKTRGKISGIADDLTRMSPMLAMNAVYFRGKWRESFNRELTKEENFVLPDSRMRKVMMMRQCDEFAYEERNGTQIAALPYRGSMRMIVVLPPKGAEFCKFCRELRGNLGTDWTRRMGWRQGELQLPRFRIDSNVALSHALRAMGMQRAFDANLAQFEGMTDRTPFFVKAVQQKDFVEVDEEGTEAAAVTEIYCLAALPPKTPPPPFKMIVDRPFVFLICDAFTDTIIFLGAVIDPQQGT